MTENIHLTVAVPLKTVERAVECVGGHFFHYLKASGRLRDVKVIADDKSSDEESTEVVFEDDIDFLRSLDPKDWKNQDHYAVLGLKSLRYQATDDDIKRAYRQKVLRHHPDKRKAQGEEIRQDDDYFTCITKAYEILGTPAKRRSFDSVDPTFDDALPSAYEIKKNFFKTFDKYFQLNARWSEKKNVPKIGDATTARDQVERFYTFWYQFESWREFSYLDEEEKEKGQDRDERRWIEKQNKAQRLKRKKEEMTRIRNLVDLAYNADPRIIKFKQDDKDRKYAVKKAKVDAAIARKAEEERQLREVREAKERADAVEKARVDLLKQERDVQKRAFKRERKSLRDYCKTHDYFSHDSKAKLENMTNMEKLCEGLQLLELEQLNKDIKTHGHDAFAKAVAQIVVKHVEQPPKQNGTAPLVDVAPVKKDEWPLEHIELLIKAVNLFPAGTNQRWDVVANFLDQHGNCHYTAKEVLAKAKDMQKTDFSKNNLKQNVNQQAFNNFERSKKKVDVKVEAAKVNGDVTDVPVVVNGTSNGDCSGTSGVVKVVQISYSSTAEVYCKFTRDYDQIRTRLMQLEEMDKTCAHEAFLRINQVVLEEWGNTTHCTVLLVTDGKLGIAGTSLTHLVDMYEHTQIKSRYTYPLMFHGKLHVLLIAAPDEIAALNSKHYYGKIVESATCVKCPDEALTVPGVVAMFETVAEETYPTSHVLYCGNFQTPVQLYPPVRPYLKTAEFERKKYVVGNDLKVCGFILLQDVGSPNDVSRHLLLSTGQGNAPNNTGVGKNPTTALETMDVDVDPSETDDVILISDESRIANFTVLLHGALKIENMAALVHVADNWFAFLYTWTDAKKKSNLVLSVLEPGVDSVPWLGNLNNLQNIYDNPHLETSTFPIKPVEKKSYSQNCVVWINNAGLQTDVQKILRHSKKLPDKIQQFYKELNRFRKAALALGFTDLLDGLAYIFERECRLLPPGLHPDVAVQLSHAANQLKKPQTRDFKINILPLTTQYNANVLPQPRSG